VDGRPCEIGLLWRGDAASDIATSRYWERLTPIIEGIARAGHVPVPLLYSEERAGDVRARLEQCRGVLVWVDPDTEGVDRRPLNDLLCDLGSSGSWVSAHPQTIAAIGTKRVLVETSDMTWGVEASELRSADELFDSLVGAAARRAVRVIKPVRGNGGRGVWRVVPSPESDTHVVVQDAARRDEFSEVLSLEAFVGRLVPEFEDGGSVIEQAYVDTARSGMVRTYVSVERVVGFATQMPSIQAEPQPLSTDPVFAMASAKTMYEANDGRFAALRRDVEDLWIPELRSRFDLADEDLPAIWDLDFLHAASGDGYALCEINVSCVSPFPPAAVPAIVACAVSRSI
jgi:hypothetical protein